MSNQGDHCGCKVGRIAVKYGLQDVDAWLTHEWRTETSVRQLTEKLNKDIVESELSAANMSGAWSRSRVYEALQTDELATSEEIEIRSELDRAGVDAAALSSALVSHQTVYRHLTQCLGASKDNDQTPAERRKKAKDTVYALQQRTALVTAKTIESLQSAGVTDLGDVDVLVDLQVVCSDCQQSMDFETAISDGCDCKTV